MNRLLLIVFIYFGSLSTLFGQNTCSEVLRQAQGNFDEGLLDNIPTLIADCMESGFTKEERANGYKLLIQTYLFSDQLVEADSVMIRFLTDFPDYSPTQSDPAEFIYLYRTYRTDPIFKLEVLLGTSFCMPYITQFYGTENIETSSPVYTSKIGAALEVNYINTLYDKFDYSAGLSMTISSLSYSNSFDYVQLTGSLSSMYIGIPLAIRYNYALGKINLLGKAGLEPVFLINSTASITRNDQDVTTRTEAIVDNNLNYTSDHRRMDLRPFLAVGTTLDIGRDYLSIVVGFKFSTISQLKAGNLYSKAAGTTSKTHYVEDDMLPHQATVSLTYIRPIYKPKKIR